MIRVFSTVMGPGSEHLAVSAVTTMILSTREKKIPTQKLGKRIYY